VARAGLTIKYGVILRLDWRCPVRRVASSYRSCRLLFAVDACGRGGAQGHLVLS
jgi:hypothetical protein